MRKISEMYRRSGGCDHLHKCGECWSYETGNHGKCWKYEGDVPCWSENYIACKFFSHMEDGEQMSLFQFCEGGKKNE